MLLQQSPAAACPDWHCRTFSSWRPVDRWAGICLVALFCFSGCSAESGATRTQRPGDDLDSTAADTRTEDAAAVASLDRVGDVKRDRQGRVIAVRFVCRHIGIAELQCLERAPFVRAVDLRECSIDEAGLELVGDLIGLKSLRLAGEGITDSALTHIAGLTELKTLGLYDCSRLTDQGLVVVDHLRNLEEIYLIRAEIGDAGVGHFAALKKMRRMVLRNTRVTSDGLAILENMKDLALLDLNECTSVDSEGMKYIRNLYRLEQLKLWFTRVSDAGLAELSGLASLRHLNLQKTRISDHGLAHLSSLPNLVTLNLSSNDISDQGLKHLEQFSRLEELSVAFCPGVSPGGVDNLKRAIPSLQRVMGSGQTATSR